jgi:hypothetical protein
MDFTYSTWIEKNSDTNNIKRIKGRVKTVTDDNKYATVTLLNDESETATKLLNKSSEILKSGDYVTVEYSNIFSSKTAYILRRNGSPRFVAYNKILTQSEYDELEANGQINDTILYVIIGE